MPEFQEPPLEIFPESGPGQVISKLILSNLKATGFSALSTKELLSRTDATETCRCYHSNYRIETSRFNTRRLTHTSRSVFAASTALVDARSAGWDFGRYTKFSKYLIIVYPLKQFRQADIKSFREHCHAQKAGFFAPALQVL